MVNAVQPGFELDTAGNMHWTGNILSIGDFYDPIPIKRHNDTYYGYGHVFKARDRLYPE